MESLLFFSLATFAITIIITKSKLLKPFRDLFLDISMDEGYYDQTIRARFYHFLQCPLCVGIWVGFVVRGLIFVWLFDITLFIWVDIIDIFLHGCIGGVVSLVGYLILIKLGFDKL